MAATPDQVRDITGSTLLDAAIQPFITAAGCFMTQITECIASMTDECKDQAEAFLAAHLLTTSSVGKGSATVAKESLRGKYSVTYLTASVTGQGILATNFGQAANAMTGGCLAQLDKNPVDILSIGSI